MVQATGGVAEGDGGKKACPSRGTRYSYAVKKEILKYAEENSVEAAAEKYGVTETSIYEWRRAGKRRGTDTGDLPTGPTGQTEEEDSKEVRDRQVLAMWRQHPGYGPSQIRNMLKRGGFRVSVGTVRHVMEQHGYLPPTLKRKEHVGRYEAARPRELYHLDFYHFFVHKQKQCVLFIEDDFSRFIPGWAMVPTEQADAVIEAFEMAVQRYGRPEGVMNDRGSAFHSWKGLSRFEALLEEYEINYFLAKSASVKE
jgi:transposase-like protein